MPRRGRRVANPDPSGTSTPSVRPLPPRYTGGRPGSETWAHFASGAAIPVTAGRARAYPGLPGAAPSTAPFYRAFASSVARPSLVIDAGCGSGGGTLVLKSAAERVIGVDRDARALAFAREWARDVEFVHSSFDEGLEGRKADAAVVADVLGHVLEPVRFLGSLRASVETNARVLVAEPSSFVAQRLSAPVRRAFSQKSLEALLVRGGFSLSPWGADTGTFLACVATASDCAAAEHFVAAARLRDEHPERALHELAEATRSGQREVQREAAIAEADVLLALRDGDGAARAFMRAAELDGTDARPLAGLALLAMTTGSQDDAMHLAARAAELDPTEPTAALALARTLEHLSPKDAFHAWRIAERLSPSDLSVATRLASLAADRGDYAFGIAVFERLRTYGDSLPMDFHVTLALLLLAEGRRADAILELRLARAIDPTHQGVCELWSELHDVAS
jgi:SAM-dependent methyltransferase